MESRRLIASSSQCAWLWSVALFGYPLVGDLVSVLQLDSRTLSIPFRILVIGMSAGILLLSGRFRTDKLGATTLVIWFIYVLRLLYDWLVADLDGADYALQFFLASTVMPALALMRARAFDQRPFALAGALVAAAGAITTLGAAYLSPDAAELAQTQGRLSLSALDPVSLGHLAVSAMLCCLVLWRGSSGRVKLLLLCALVPLLVCLVLTGSKGPALAFALCCGLWALRRGHTFKFALLVVPLLVLGLAANVNPLTSRFSSAEEDESTTDRVVILADSIKQIEAAPWIGSAFVELNSGYYPHNVLIEAALAFGIPVALVFAGVISVGAYRAWATLKTRGALLGLLYVQGLFAALVSGAIFGSALLWISLVLLPHAGSGGIRRGVVRRAAESSQSTGWAQAFPAT